MNLFVRTLLCLLLSIGVVCAQGLDLIKDGDRARMAGDYEKARVAYEAALKSGNLNQEQTANVFWKLGSVVARAGEYTQAIGHFTKSIDVNKNYAAYGLRAYTRALTAEYSLAESDYVEAMRLSTESGQKSWVQEMHADLYRRQKNFQKALELTNLSIKSGDDTSFFRRAWIYMDMRRISEAKADLAAFERVLNRDPNLVNRFWIDEKDALKRLRELK